MKRLLVIMLDACILTLAHAQTGQGSGKPYGTRDPQTCSSSKEPAKGAPSAEVAARYVRCQNEGVGPGNDMYLRENVKVEVGKPTPFLQLPRGQRPGEADPDGLVYPIRGSYTQYQCAVPSAIMNNFGKNCNTYENTNASGQCYRTGFGDWRCDMLDLSATNNPVNRSNVPPPH